MLDLHIFVQYNIFAMEKQNEKSCDNGFYFHQHFHINKNGKLIHIWGDGHCSNDKLTVFVSRKIIFKQHICEFWEPNENKEAERRENICKVISDMKKRLDELALLLKED